MRRGKVRISHQFDFIISESYPQAAVSVLLVGNEWVSKINCSDFRRKNTDDGYEPFFQLQPCFQLAHRSIGRAWRQVRVQKDKVRCRRRMYDRVNAYMHSCRPYLPVSGFFLFFLRMNSVNVLAQVLDSTLRYTCYGCESIQFTDMHRYVHVRRQYSSEQLALRVTAYAHAFVPVLLEGSRDN